MGLPKDFLWGGSISATQAEGAWDKDGKSPVLTDFAISGSAKKDEQHRLLTYRLLDHTHGEAIMKVTGAIPDGAEFEIRQDVCYPNHEASDFYHHYKEDIALFAEMGFTAFNTSISWARVLPYGLEGGVNKKGVEFYRNVFTECRKYGIEPIITLYKYDEPVFLQQKYGGWENRAMIDEFLEFAKICFAEYSDHVKRWVTFNEINIAIMIGSVTGEKDEMQRKFQETHHQIVAAAKTVRFAHEMEAGLEVGCMIAGTCFYPLTCDPDDVLAAQERFQDKFCYCADAMIRGKYPSFSRRLWKKNQVFLEISEQDLEDMLLGKSDFLGFSYYNSSCITTHADEGSAVGGNFIHGAKNPYLKESDWGWTVDPKGFRYFLHLINDRYGVPLLDLENGLGAYDILEEDGRVHDPYRIAYLREHIANMKQAVEEGVNLIGYTIWSPIDLVSASTGQLEKRYGVIYVNRNDMGEGDFSRIKKDSFYWYQKVIHSNGECLE